MPTQLRHVLQEARPTWTQESLDAVERKLGQIGIDDTEALATAVQRHELNDRLRKANLTTFNADTVRDIRQALSARQSPNSTPTEVPVLDPRRERTSWMQAMQKARDSGESHDLETSVGEEIKSAQENHTEGQEVEEGPSSTRPSAMQVLLNAGTTVADKEQDTVASSSAGRREKPSWMQAMQRARHHGDTAKDTEADAEAKKVLAGESTVRILEPREGSNRAPSHSLGSVDESPALLRAEEGLQRHPLEEGRDAEATSSKSSMAPGVSQTTWKSVFTGVPLGGAAARGSSKGETPEDEPERPAEAATSESSNVAAWYEKGRRLREKLLAARTRGDIPASRRAGSLGTHHEAEQYLCSDCGLWPASSDPADDGSGGYCDNCWFKWEGPLVKPPTPKRNQVLLVRTAKDQGLRLSRMPPLTLQMGKPKGGEVTVVLDPSTKYQTFLGFGGAFTESSAKVFQKLSSANQGSIIKAYFDEESGLGYSFGRLHMTSCDFSDGNWTCCDTPFDVAMDTFSIERFREAIFPMVKLAHKARGGERLKLLASPWSPPAWMKASGAMCVKGDKWLPEYLGAWARYFVRFAEEVEKEGLPLWGFTVQNEPYNRDVAWETCIVSAEEERDFVKGHLVPALRAAGFHQEPRVIVYDHNRDHMVEWAQTIYKDPDAADDIWGMAFHWYGDLAYRNVQYVHDMYPDKHLVHTEGCKEGEAFLGEWRLGELYGENVIQDLNHWTEAWLDWNLVLDEQGGPNHAGNYCSAPVIADTHKNAVFYQPSYYYLGHFSRHIRPGAVRISCVMQGALDGYDELYFTAFLNLDTTIVVIALNNGDWNVDFNLCIDGHFVRASAPEHSITTMTVLDVVHHSPQAILEPAPEGEEDKSKPVDKYCIVGSWDDWKATRDMEWDADERCYHYTVQLGPTGEEGFQILVDGEWSARLHPDTADGCHHSGSVVCGPDNHCHDKNWTIGRHPLDHSLEGARYRVRLLLSPFGAVRAVDWLHLGDPPGSPRPVQKYCIVGTWDDWKSMHKMMWDGSRRCYHYTLQLTTRGEESFQILVDGDWTARLHPDEADGCHHIGSAACGPDDQGHGKNWTVGRHPRDAARPGVRYRIQLWLKSSGEVREVDWLRQDPAATD